jgi:bacterial/archaeal transporter family protein
MPGWSLSHGGPVLVTAPIVFGGSIALTAALAPVLYGEAFTLRRAIGIALAAAAPAILATGRE